MSKMSPLHVKMLMDFHAIAKPFEDGCYNGSPACCEIIYDMSLNGILKYPDTLSDKGEELVGAITCAGQLLDVLSEVDILLADQQSSAEEGFDDNRIAALREKVVKVISEVEGGAK